MNRDEGLDPGLRAKYGSYRNLPWVRRRIGQLAAILALPVEAVWAWDDDWQREAVAVASWERLQAQLFGHGEREAALAWFRDPATPRAIKKCQQAGLSVENVRRADDRALLALDGLGPKGVRSLRAGLQLAHHGGAAPPLPPLPAWLVEE